jgi:hypothetical protein
MIFTANEPHAARAREGRSMSIAKTSVKLYQHLSGEIRSIIVLLPMLPAQLKFEKRTIYIASQWQGQPHHRSIQNDTTAASI